MLGQAIGLGAWSGRSYAEVMAEAGPILDRATGLFTCRPPGGETYGEIAVRLKSWLDDTEGEPGDRLVVMHGMSSRVLRGLLTGAAEQPGCGAPVADGLRQGAIAEIAGGAERVLDAGEAFEPF